MDLFVLARGVSLHVLYTVVYGNSYDLASSWTYMGFLLALSYRNISLHAIIPAWAVPCPNTLQ